MLTPAPDLSPVSAVLCFRAEFSSCKIRHKIRPIKRAGISILKCLYLGILNMFSLVYIDFQTRASLLCLNKSSLDHSQLFQDAAARLLTRSNRMTHIMPVLHSLHWLSVNFRYHYKVFVFTYRAIYSQAPSSISKLFHPYLPNRSLRTSDQSLLVVSLSCLKNKGDPMFEVVALTECSALSIDFHYVASVEAFKK